MIKILVAEDETKSREALISRLRVVLGESALIEGAADGNEAVAKTLKIKPDLIFMDVEMPNKNGLEAAAIVKKQLPEVHIVFLTAYDRFEYAVGAMRSGGEDYLLKPVAEPELRELLHKYFLVSLESEKEMTPFEAALSVWMRQHYAEEVSLEDAAAHMNMSAFYFSRQVKATTGMTFLTYFTNYRIERAKRRLEKTDMTVSEVGKSVGYADSNYFTKVFKRVTGFTPSVYREQLER